MSPAQARERSTRSGADRTLRGAFGLSGQVGVVRFAEIQDGTSNTLMYGEVIQTQDGTEERTLWWDDLSRAVSTPVYSEHGHARPSAADLQQSAPQQRTVYDVQQHETLSEQPQPTSGRSERLHVRRQRAIRQRYD